MWREVQWAGQIDGWGHGGERSKSYLFVYKCILHQSLPLPHVLVTFIIPERTIATSRLTSTWRNSFWSRKNQQSIPVILFYSRPSWFSLQFLFWLKRCISCHPLSTPFCFSLHRSKVLYSPKTLPATPWTVFGPRPAPGTTCARIENKTPGYIAKDNSYVASWRWKQVGSNDGQFHCGINHLLIQLKSMVLLSQSLLNQSLSNVRFELSSKTRQIKPQTFPRPLHRQPECQTSLPDSAAHNWPLSNQMPLTKNKASHHQHLIIESVLRCCSSLYLLRCLRRIDLIGRITSWKTLTQTRTRGNRTTNFQMWCLEWPGLTIDSRNRPQVPHCPHYNQNQRDAVYQSCFHHHIAWIAVWSNNGHSPWPLITIIIDFQELG